METYRTADYSAPGWRYRGENLSKNQVMNRRTLIALPAAVVGALAVWLSLCSPRVSAPPKAPAPSVPVYNPYPPGILPSNLSSEISRVLREVDVIESRALARWHALQR